ncbi:MAG: hypothetical protein ABIQ99_07685 [Thermoflexales bacterium]
MRRERGGWMAGLARALVAALLLALPATVVAADDSPSGPPSVQMVPGTVAIDSAAEDAIREALADAKEALPAVEAYAVTDVRILGDHAFVSVIGLAGLMPGKPWNLLDNGAWFGLVALERRADDRWTGAVEGTLGFSAIIERIPDHVLDTPAKVGLDPLRRPGLPASAIHLPWPDGTSMYYGSLGVHSNGFPSLVSGWLAVDMLSDGNTAVGHAPNQLLASAGGTITYRCSPAAGETSTAIKIGSLMYTHLLYSANLYVGRTVTQGETLGQLKTGTFSEVCGYASQGAGWFHVHWGFPNTSPFEAGGWSLNLSDSIWRRGNQSRSVNTWLRADPDVPARVYYFPQMMRR